MPKKNVNQTLFFKYYLLDTKESIDLYRSHGDLDIANVEKIISYTPDSTHTDFFHTLTYLQDELDSIELLGKRTIEYAEKKDMDNLVDTLRKLYSKLKKLHPSFFSTDLACIEYILQSIASYYNASRFERTMEYWHLFETKFEQANIFLQDSDKKALTYIIQYSSQITKDAMWLTLALSAASALIKNTASADEYRFRINNNAATSLTKPKRVFSTLYELCDLISNYSHTADEYLKYYQKLSLLQVNTLFISTHPLLRKIMSSNIPHTSSDSLSIILWWKMKKCNKEETNKKNLVDFTTSDFGNEITGHLYDSFNEQMLSEESSKSEIEQETFQYFPIGIEKYFSYTITNINGFNELLATEFYYILSQGIALHKCAHTNCRTYILTTTKKIKYCPNHSHAAAYQKKYSERKNECQLFFTKLNTTLLTRVRRGALEREIYEQWLTDAKKILDEHSKNSTYDYENEFRKLLNNYNLSIRKYKE